jgi:signal peptide peptidase SppA
VHRGSRPSPWLLAEKPTFDEEKESEGKTMKYAHALATLSQQVWAIKEETLEVMQSLLRQRSEGERWSAEEIRNRIADANAASGYVSIARGGARFLAADHEVGLPTGKGGGIAMERPTGERNFASAGSIGLIPIVGIISHRMSMMSEVSGAGAGASIQKLTAQFRQALNEPNCKAIVFDCDSPGGSVDGVMELASEIYNARSQKPITAVVNSTCCSAAYWLASSAQQIICTPSGQAGSIGVYMTHEDISEALKREGIKVSIIKAGKYKIEGNSSEPLQDEARAALQSKVDDYYGFFVRAVAQNRGTSQTAVRGGYGQGRSVLAADAVKQGLVDGVGTLDEVLGSLGVGGRRSKIASGQQTARRMQLSMMRLGETISGGSTSSAADRRRMQLAMRKRQMSLL